MLIEIRNRWNRNVVFTHTVEGNTLAITLAMALDEQKNGRADLRGADLSSADLSSADLRGANLLRVDLSGTGLSYADLSGVDLHDSDLRDAPIIQNIHQTVFSAVSLPGALNIDSWHCGTAHCRAGWVITLAGEEGKALEDKIGTSAAAMAIYMASDIDRWKTERLPNFFCNNKESLADMKRMAEEEASKQENK
jgi:uncharacterized protein YjbI with pentapeptide repeats